jgi:transposase
MLNQGSENQVRNEGRKPRLNKKAILEIVRAVERGATRREVIDRYGVPKATLSLWMQEHGSPAYLASIKPMSASDRRSMVRAIEAGRMTMAEAKVFYKLPSLTVVKGCLRQCEREKAELHRIATLMDKNEARSEAISSEDVKALKKALEEAELKIKALNTLIDIAEDQFKIAIRKKPGAKQS